MKLSKDEILKKANASCKDTLMETLHIEFVDAGDDFVIAKMPVTKRYINQMAFYMEVLL